MNRRTFTNSMGAAMASLMAHPAFAEGAEDQKTDAMASVHNAGPSGPPQQIGMLIYPNMTALDLIGPHTFLAGLMNVDVHLLWKTKTVIMSDRGVPISATTTFAECPRDLDVLFVPGGTKGTIAVMNDDEVIPFLVDRGSRARYVTSVCTGSLVLGAAGLLNGYKATSHWYVRDLLPLLGAEPVAERVVIDRNRITGAGVTSGIDFGLVLSSKMRGENFAKTQQLVYEYDPQPPFHAGSPQAAGLEITAPLRKMLTKNHELSKQAALQARKRMGVA